MPIDFGAAGAFIARGVAVDVRGENNINVVVFIARGPLVEEFVRRHGDMVLDAHGLKRGFEWVTVNDWGGDVVLTFVSMAVRSYCDANRAVAAAHRSRSGSLGPPFFLCVMRWG